MTKKLSFGAFAQDANLPFEKDPVEGKRLLRYWNTSVNQAKREIEFHKSALANPKLKEYWPKHQQRLKDWEQSLATYERAVENTKKQYNL